MPTFFLVGACLGAATGCTANDGAGSATNNADNAGADDGSGNAVTFRGEVWGDNWSSFYANGTLVMEDSVSITTERSFNAEVFEFTGTYPLTIAVVLKDYVETDSGLEYIGEPNQQMGDGGYIMQVKNTVSGEVVAVSSSAFRCFVQFTAPLNKECASSASPDTDCQFERRDEPAGWQQPGFDDSDWVSATEWSEADVSPKDGYDEISWEAGAKLIWGTDLEADNTILCRYTVTK